MQKQRFRTGSKTCSWRQDSQLINQEQQQHERWGDRFQMRLLPSAWSCQRCVTWRSLDSVVLPLLSLPRSPPALSISLSLLLSLSSVSVSVSISLSPSPSPGYTVSWSHVDRASQQGDIEAEMGACRSLHQKSRQGLSGNWQPTQKKPALKVTQLWPQQSSTISC